MTEMNFMRTFVDVSSSADRFDLRHDETGAPGGIVVKHRIREMIVVLADVFPDLGSLAPAQVESTFPGSRVRAGILDCDVVFQGSRIRPGESFSEVKPIRM